MRFRHVNTKLCYILSALLFSISSYSYADNLLLEPFLGSVGEVTFDANILAVSEEAGYVIFSSRATLIPGYDGPENTSKSELVYIKDLNTEEITLLVQTESGEPAQNIDTENFSEISNNNAVFFVYWGNQPLSGVEYDGHWNDLGTRLFKLNITSKIITPVPSPHNYFYANRWLITKNEVLYTYNQNNNKVIFSDDMGATWTTLDLQCRYGVTFHDYTASGAMLFTCEDYNFLSAQYFEPESQTISTLSGMPYAQHSNVHYSDGIEISGDGEYVVFTQDDIIHKLNKQTGEVQKFPMEAFGITDAKIMVMDENASFVLLSGHYFNTIYFEGELQQFNSSRYALFYVALTENSSPKRVNIIQDDSTSALSLSRVFLTSSEHSIFFQSFYNTEYIRSSYQADTSELIALDFSPEYTYLNLLVTNSDVHANNVKVEHDSSSEIMFKIARRNEKYNKTDFFWLEGSEYSDYQLGLKPGNNSYIVYPCNLNFICDENEAIATEVTTVDFAQSDDWTLDISESSNYYSSSLRGTLANFNWPSSEYVQVSLINTLSKTVNSNQEYGFNIDVRIENLTVGVRPCTRSKLNNENYICAEQASVKSIGLPAQPKTKLLMAPDYSYLAVYFEQHEGLVYNVQRREADGDYVEVANDIASGWQDNELSPGSTYYYRIAACDTELAICKYSNAEDILIDRKSAFSINAYNNNSWNASLRLYNNFDVDELIISRAMSSSDYQEVARVPAETEYFVDWGLVPGITYYYKVESRLNGEKYQEATDYINTSDLHNISTEPKAEITGLTIDSTFALGHYLSWDAIENINKWRVTIFTNGYIESDETISTEGMPSYFFNYGRYLVGSTSLNYQITPIFEECSNQQNGCNITYGATSSIVGEIPANLLSEKQLYPAELNVSQKSLNMISLQIGTSYLFEGYRVERKLASDNVWQLITHLNTSNQYESLINFEDSVVELTSGETYQYRVTTCSPLLKQCATSKTQSIVYRGTRYSDNPKTPSVTLVNSLFTVDFNYESQDFIGFAELAVTTENNQRNTWYVSDLSADLQIPSYWDIGDLISFSVRYCFHRPNWPYYESEDCTEFSEESTIEITAEGTLLLPQLGWLSVEPTSEQDAFRIYGSFYTNSDSGRPETIELFRAINGNNHESIDVISIADDGNYEYEFVDTDIVPGTYYHYGVKACNQDGCDELVTSTISTSQAIEAEIPAPPQITYVSQEEYTNKIRIEFRSSTNDIYFYGYRAESPDAEFQQFDYTSWRNYLVDDNVLANQTYYYRVDACNTKGCSSSDIVQGKTGSVYFNQTITLSGEALRQENNDLTSLFTLEGSSRAIDGTLDAFSGDLQFNQWLDLSEGWKFSTIARLDANWPECSELLAFNLYFPEAGSSYYTDQKYTQTLSSLIYTGNGCNDTPELELFSLYLQSPYLDSPIKIEADLRENWHDYRLEFNEHGLFSLFIDDEIIATADEKIDLNILGLSKFLLTTHSDWYNESTYISSATLEVEAQSSLSETDLFSYYSPDLNAIHPRNVALKLSPELEGNVQYLSLKNYSFGNVTDLELHSNGKYSAYIKALSPNKEYQLLIRQCQSEVCGPFEYVKVQTPGYSESLYTSGLNVNINYQSLDIRISPWRYSTENVDSYTIYRKLIDDESDPQAIGQFTVDELLEHWLNSNEYYFVTDTLEENQTAEYSYEICNPIACKTSDSVQQITMPGDSDNDGVLDPLDAFPNDPNETLDTDGDGIGNNADEDDDGDNIPDSIEIANGLDPLNDNDALEDLDGDGYSNLLEFATGSEINDPIITPEQSSLYESFASERSNYVAITGNYNRSDYSAEGDYSIASDVESGGSNSLLFTIEGKLTDNFLVFAMDQNASTFLYLRINDELHDYSRYPLTYLGYNSSFQYIGFQLDATDEIVKLELEIQGYYSSYPTTVYIDNLFIPMTDAKLTGQRVVADYDGDGNTDVTVRRGSLGINYVLNSSDSQIQRVQFGSQEEDIQVEGDFDGDGVADIAVRRPSKGIWYVQNSSGGNFGSEREDGIQRVVFGKQADDVPVAADYDGDGITDFAVRRASNSMWYIKNSSGGNYNSDNEDGIQRVRFGLQATDIPVPADYDGDGIADIAFRRPSNSTWYILESSSGEIQRVVFGKQANDIPVPADYDGDGKADVAFRRPSNKTWYVLRSSDDVIERTQFGLNTADIPVVGDYDGDGKADIAVRRESNSMWYILQSSDGEIGRVNFGKSDGMVPVLAPIWEKLNMLGWQQDFIDATLAGKASAKTLDEDEEIFFEKTQFFNHAELVEVERINQEPLH